MTIQKARGSPQIGSKLRRLGRELDNKRSEVSHAPSQIHFGCRRRRHRRHALGGRDVQAWQTRAPGARVLHVEDDLQLHEVVRSMAGAQYDFEIATTLREGQPDTVIADAVRDNFKEPLQHRRLRYFAELLAGHERKGGNSLSSRMALISPIKSHLVRPR